MGVYIKGMEMPKDRPQLLWIYPNGKAMTVQSEVDPWKELQAAPIPPHGRCIDADALHYSRIRIAHNDGTIGGNNAVVMSAEIKDAPTIIEAEV